MKWKLPPKLKIYEALGAIADGRVELEADGATVYSSARKRAYTIRYDPESQTLSSNDNASYWQRYYGYPVIAYLLASGRISYDESFLPYLTDFSWGSLNVRFKRNYPRLEAYIREMMEKRGLKDATAFDRETIRILRELKGLDLDWEKSELPPPR